MWIGVQVNGEHSGAVNVTCPFKVSGYLLGASGQPMINSLVSARVASKTEDGFTDEGGYFELNFQVVEPGGPYPLYLNGEANGKLSVSVEEDFAWVSPTPSEKNRAEFIESIQKKRTLFESVRSPRSSVPQMVAANQIIVFFGTKAGLGTSSLAAAVARELYSQGVPVMVIEAAKSGGSLIRMFSGSPSSEGLDTLTVATPDEIGETTMAPVLIEIRKGLEILPISAGGNLRGTTGWTLQTAKELYRWASRRSGYVVVDAGSDLTFPLANAAIWMANKIFPVAGESPVAIDSALRFGSIATESHWTRAIPGWVIRGHGTGELELLAGVKTGFVIKDSPDWAHISEGKTTGLIKKSVSKIIETAQVVLGGAIS